MFTVTQLLERAFERTGLYRRRRRRRMKEATTAAVPWKGGTGMTGL